MRLLNLFRNSNSKTRAEEQKDAENLEVAERLRESSFFDSVWYAATYPDVQMIEMDPALHYVKYGAALGRNPSADFDTNFYLETYQDVAEADINPLLHYLDYGLIEARFPNAATARENTTPAEVGAAGFTPPPEHHLPVKDLERKLWGGFAKHALEDLKASLHSEYYDKASKARAAFVLGRWYALQEDWELALEVLRGIRRYDLAMYRSRKCKVLRIQCFIRAGEYDNAQEIIDFELNKEPDGDFALAKSNLLFAKNGTSAASERLEAINSVFRASDLTEIELEDDSRGFVFDNLKYDLEPANGVDGPLVSILMPVYKAGEFIDVAMKSLLAQTWRNIEIIAVDDCSPDDSWDRLQEWAARDSRLKISQNPKNLGAYPTRNRALSLSTGDYVTVHDSDDWSHPQMIEKQMEALLESDHVRVTCSSMARVYPNMDFILRPQRGNLEYVHRSYPSVLIAKSDLEILNCWDGISANADDEFVQRARMLWGPEAVVDIMKNVPFSFFLVHENSLTQQKGTNLNSLTFGIRKEYARAAAYWRKKQSAEGQLSLSFERTGPKDPFPIPMGLAPKDWPRNNEYDLILISDLSLLGGTRRCNEGYIQAALDQGMRVGLFHWPRYDLRIEEIADEYLELAYHENLDILVREDEVSCKHVLIHHPPILKFEIEATPKITTEGVSILVNQSPMQLYSQPPFYYDGATVEEMCRKLFGHTPTWIAIASHVSKILDQIGGFSSVKDEIWSPPYHGELPEAPPAPPANLGKKGSIVIGRHARDHWTKWPQRASEIYDAYCADKAGISTRLLGGAGTPKKMLGLIPENWDVLEFDSVNVKDFVEGLDFFLHFTHSDYIEEFGRNVMEAMAAGRLVILPDSFKETFGDAAVYCKPKEVSVIVDYYWNNPEMYQEQAQKGFDFVVRNCSQHVVRERIQGLVK